MWPAYKFWCHKEGNVFSPDWALPYHVMERQQIHHDNRLVRWKLHWCQTNKIVKYKRFSPCLPNHICTMEANWCGVPQLTCPQQWSPSGTQGRNSWEWVYSQTHTTGHTQKKYSTTRNTNFQGKSHCSFVWHSRWFPYSWMESGYTKSNPHIEPIKATICSSQCVSLYISSWSIWF